MLLPTEPLESGTGAEDGWTQYITIGISQAGSR